MDEVFTIAELAQHWKCSPDIIYDLLRSGALRGFKLGAAWRISAAAVNRYEEGGETA